MAEFSERNWQLIRKVARVSDEWKHQPSDAATRYAYHMNAVINAARFETADIRVKILDGEHAGEIWLVGPGMRDSFISCGDLVKADE